MNNQETLTHDLSKFGSRERAMAGELLKAWSDHGLPDEFDDNDVTIEFNINSGYVFLTNSDFQVAMMNGNNLELYYSCPECGHEGFKEEMNHEGNNECKEYVKQIMES